MSWSILISGEDPTTASGTGAISRYLADETRGFPSLGYPTKLLSWRQFGQSGKRKFLIGKQWFSYDMVTSEWGDNFASNEIIPSTKKYTPDLFMSFGDPLTFSFVNPSLLYPCEWLVYLAVDSFPIWADYINMFRNIKYLVVYTKWARGLLAKYGINTVDIPHGIDLSLFKPLNREQKERLKAKYSLKGKKILGFVGFNQRRKRPDLFLEIMSKLVEKDHNYIGLCHTYPFFSQGWTDYPLNIISGFLGTKDNVFFPQDIGLTKKISFENMWEVYGLMDILINTSAAGAWEFPLQEACASKVPFITNDFNAMNELAQRFGQKAIRPKSLEIAQGLGSNHAVADVQAFVDEIINTLDNKVGYNELSEAGYKAVQELSWDKVMTQHWKPYLEGILPNIPENWLGELAKIKVK